MKPITIIGGGLAGLSLGIGLRRQGIPVTVFEAGHYPRHRVCGEFISGLGLESLERLGLRDELLRAGAIPAQTAAFFLLQSHSPTRPLPAPALSLSRFTLDALLARLFRESGGALWENQPRRRERWEEGTVLANGRRLEPAERGGLWFGLKVHARHVLQAADLEMHALPNGYVGISRLSRDEANVCGIFGRPRPGRRALGAPASLPAGLAKAETPAKMPALPVAARAEALRGHPGSSLRQRLANAVFDESSFSAVAGISLAPRRAAEAAECRLGDALTMIPPVTGNGMSMAFEAAELAIAPLAAYSRGEISWTRARREIALACDAAFARRLAWARWLHWMMFTPLLRGPLGAVPLRSGWFWRLMFERTR